MELLMSIPLWNINVLNATFPGSQFSNVSRPSGNIANNAAASTEAAVAASCQQLAAAGENNVPFPSCYTWPQIILFALFMAVVMFVIVFGNLLVIISIMSNASLKTVQNYLLVSLAVADSCVGALIMPFSLANELMGYWAFGDILCDSWLALDVLLCTASIFSLCAISLDRYWSVTQAVTYLQRRTPGRAAFMIAAVWVLSLLISVPPLFGWRNPPNATEIVTFDNGTYHQTSFVKTCSIGEDTSEYGIFSSLASFWIPLALISFVYIRIYMVAKSRASGPSGPPTSHKTVLNNAPVPAISVQNHHAKPPGHQHRSSVITADTHVPNSSTTATASSNKSCEKKPLLTKPSIVPASSSQRPSTIEESASDSRSPTSENTSSSSSEKKLKHKNTPRKKDVGTQTDVVIEDAQRPSYIDDDEFADSSSIMLLSEYDFDARWRDFFDRYIASPEAEKKNSLPGVPNGLIATANVAVISAESVPFWRRLRQFFSQLVRQGSTSSSSGYRLQVNRQPHRRKTTKKKAKKKRSSGKKKNTDLQDEAERRKRRIQRTKERRATLVVTLVIATFVACWMPFFAILPLQAICGKERCPIHTKFFATVFWLGYFNSALNPVIYTIFNRDMRKAFKRVLLGNDYARKKENRRQRGGI